MSKEFEQELSEIKICLRKIETTIKNSKIEKSHYKVDEACLFLSCCRNTLTNICIEYDIYPTKVLGVNYYKIEDLKQVFVRTAS